jgi:hypothetical protein
MGGIQAGKARAHDHYINMCVSHSKSMLVSGTWHTGAKTPTPTCSHTCLCCVEGSTGAARYFSGSHDSATAAALDQLTRERVNPLPEQAILNSTSLSPSSVPDSTAMALGHGHHGLNRSEKCRRTASPLLANQVPRTVAIRAISGGCRDRHCSGRRLRCVRDAPRCMVNGFW